MSNKNNTPQQKAQWKANQSLGSRFGKVISSSNYLPDQKPLSRRDKHRQEVASR